MERSRRLVLWIVVAVVAAPFWKGRGEPRIGEPVAFLRYSAPIVVVRLKGDNAVPGVYRFPDGVDVATVINMTAPSVAVGVINESVLKTRLQSGAILELPSLERQQNEIRISTMTATEKMLLGIPLHPDYMDEADWDNLPGIGPELAHRIVIDRQKNGVFGSLQAVERVPGMGKGKIAKIRIYF